MCSYMAEIRKILFVCLGNICRSPTAEGVAQARFEQAGLGHIELASAGTGDWHVGKAPDMRAQKAAAQRGYTLAHLRARQVTRTDFEAFDLILAMDKSNLADLQARQPAATSRAKLALLLDYAPGRAGQEVPDPYFGPSDGAGDGFAEVLDLIEEAIDGLIAELA